MENLTESEQQVLDFIRLFVRVADECCTTLQQAFGLDFTRVGRTLRADRMGHQGKAAGISYAFHGIGCWFKTARYEVDVDFDSQGNWHGFDAWRIHYYIKHNHGVAAWTEMAVELGLQTLLAKQYLYQTDRALDQRFYYLPP